ncbi:MAG TPA: HlyD family efflux transporter periplasmic adaptor subunit [Pirellulaceae bacterium]|jgi:multidrug efflux pump subunit AcrA (membrane-fusion protein)
MPASSTAVDLQARDSSRAVDEIVNEIERLAASDLSEQDFYAALVAKIALLGCPAAAVWTVEGTDAARLAWSSVSAAAEQNGDVGRYENDVVGAVGDGHPKVTDSAVAANGAGVIAGRSVIAPWSSAIATRGALQTWLAERASTAAISGYLRVLSGVADIVGGFLDRQQQRRARRQFELMSRLDTFVRGLYESLELNQVAYKIANDGRVLIGCDRLSVLNNRGGKYKAIAVSGADHVHRRAESIHKLEKLAMSVAKVGDPLWQSGRELTSPELLPQIRDALSDYLDVSPAVACAVLPLTARGAQQDSKSLPPAILVIEQYAAPFDSAVQDLAPLVAEHSRLALANARQLAAIPGHRFWLRVNREGWLSRLSAKVAAGCLAVAAIAAALVLIPADVKINARGELQPVERHDVFAPRDGVVTAIHVDHGHSVAAGDALLEMRSPELDLEVQRVDGELETARKRLAAAQSERLQTRPTDNDARLRQRRLTAEEEQYQQQVRDLTNRQKMLAEQRKDLIVRSPIAGEVVTWNVQQQLASRPLRRGDALVTVADITGQWQLELKVPSRRAGRLLAARQNNSDAQPVSFVLATSPGHSLSGAVREVASRLELDEAGDSYIMAKVDVPRDEIENRAPGATALAKIDCGRGTLAEAWFHDLIDTIQLWLPF